ncbi:hypothetical protein K1T71_013661 [Dendrolimus kikuchii]|uniref:Uncharacterized protein n=1 Tax=Dendrolimus kikuchii TaxID=765133 RepID=A0ACC1CHF2_9NEOP|nr:hypothetical protein K1T71_013661 [Dendrolimus kikuchii]
MLCTNIKIFIVLLYLLTNTKSLDLDSQYLDLEATVTSRPLPHELQVMFNNKTDFELMMEDCMREYASCLGSNIVRLNPICAIKENNERKVFNTLCDMGYINCKLQRGAWRYMRDTIC